MSFERPGPSVAVRGFPILETVAICLAALLVRLANLDHTAFEDEINHVIAGASLLREGAPLLESGAEYVRARHFTWIVAASMAIFGEGLPAARIPSVLAGTLLVLAVFLWVRTAFGRWEAWTAGLLVLLAPQAIYHSQLARFYSFQALYILGAAWCAWKLAGLGTWRSRSAPLLAAAGLVLAWAAVSIQFSSLVALGTIGLWLIGALGVRGHRAGMLRTSPGWSVLAVLGIVLGVASWLHFSGVGAQAVQLFDYADTWAAGNRSNLRFYHDHLLSHYALLWAAFPIIGLAALGRRPSLTSLWLLVFVAVFGVHSVAAWKSERYIFYVLPFFFALAGVVVGPLLRWLLGEFTRIAAGILGPGDVRLASAAAAGLLAFSLLFAAWSTSAFPYAVRMIAGSDASWPFPILYRGEADWRAVGRELQGRIEDADVVVVSSEHKPRYLMGRGDLFLSAQALDENDSGAGDPEFPLNWKTGVPMIYRPEAVDLVVACQPSGLFLVERAHWRKLWTVTDAAADRIEELARSVPLPAGTRMLAFEWDHGPGFEAPAADCVPLLQALTQGEAVRAPPS